METFFDRKKSYRAKLLDPRWQKKRLLILERDGWKCCYCGDSKSTLHVHHLKYNNSDPWDIDDKFLISLCETCHEFETVFRLQNENELLQVLKEEKFSCWNIDTLTRSFKYNPHKPCNFSKDDISLVIMRLLESENDFNNLLDKYKKIEMDINGKI